MFFVDVSVDGRGNQLAFRRRITRKATHATITIRATIVSVLNCIVDAPRIWLTNGLLIYGDFPHRK